MRVIRLGVVLVVLAGCGVASAQEPPPVACPAGLLGGDVVPPVDGGTDCVCPDTGEHVGNVWADGTWHPSPIDDGDCSTPYPPVPVEGEPPAVEAVTVTPVAAPASAPTGSVLRRTG